MKQFGILKTVFCAALLGAMIVPGARADEWNRKTTLTFSGPVEIPGVHLKGWGVLPAGTYVFKILDSSSDRHIVQIFDKDETTIYATILAIPNYRLQATDKTVLTFRERPAGQPEALRAWFYPGMKWGEEFVYPKAKAIELAKETNVAVLFTPLEIPFEVAQPIKTADEPVVVQLKQAPVLAIKPTGEEVELAQVVTPPPAQTQIADAGTPAQTQIAGTPAETQIADAGTPADTRTLPKTASPLPLIGLFGLLLLGVAITLRFVERRAA